MGDSKQNVRGTAQHRLPTLPERNQMTYDECTDIVRQVCDRDGYMIFGFDTPKQIGHVVPRSIFEDPEIAPFPWLVVSESSLSEAIDQLDRTDSFKLREYFYRMVVAD